MEREAEGQRKREDQSAASSGSRGKKRADNLRHIENATGYRDEIFEFVLRSINRI